ncbi:MAG: hypothetical protein ABJA71_08925, partial [Ginsengibacter sp.]
MKKISSNRAWILLLNYFLFLSCKVATAQNSIVMENRKAGTTDWVPDKVHADTCHLEKPYKAAYFCRQQDIEGYCSHASIKAGETLNVFVSMKHASSFKVDIYRMGYYGGKGGRKMMSLGPIEARPQPTPDDG